MAAELADAGVDVVVVEEGGYHPTESFTAEAGRALRTLYRDGGLGLALGKPPVLFSEGRCVGGSTVVNGGMSWRTPGRVLQRWAEEEGIAAIGERDMEPHFAKVESRISVARQDPETIGNDMRLLKAGADAKGWKIIPNLRNQLHCAGTNNCTNGCPTGAKRSMLVTNVPRALARGARLFADCRVERITRSGGIVTGIEGRFVRPGGHRGPRLTVRAQVVVAAGGAVQTPALLARSGLRSPVRAAWPQPQPAPQRQGDRILRRGSGRLARRASGLPGPRVRRRRHPADGGQPAAVAGRARVARPWPRPRPGDGRLQPHDHGRLPDRGHRYRAGAERPWTWAAGVLPAHRPRCRTGGARDHADRRADVRRRGPPDPAAVRRRARGARSGRAPGSAGPPPCPRSQSSCSRCT